MKQKGIVAPYPFTWKGLSPKFKQPNQQSFDGRGAPRQHICNFKAFTGGIAGNDALMIRLFVSTLCETAFDWYARLPAGTINSWADEEEKFLTHVFDEDAKSTTGQLCATKQAHNDSVDSFMKGWRALAVKCPEPHSHESLTDMCRMNFNFKPRLKLVWA